MSTSAEIVAWTCFVTGTALLLAGVAIGLYLTFSEQVRKARKQVRAKLDQAKRDVERLKVVAIEAAHIEGPSPAAAASVASAAEDTKGTLESVGEIVASLPEAMRFPGLLIIVGAVLMSVATVQFGGQSLF